jgi:hypothetical protein
MTARRLGGDGDRDGDRCRRRHASLYLLSDHLDAVLAAGEDMLCERVELCVDPARDGCGEARSRDVAAFVQRVYTLELTMTARLLEARKRARELKRSENGLEALTALLLAGTVPLVDAVAELGDSTRHGFETGAATTAFLRSRGLIARDVAGIAHLQNLAVGEDYLVAARVPLGVLLDLTATFLDTLDRTYDLYPEPAAA